MNSDTKPDICDRYSSLMRSESRGIVTKHKAVVLRGSLSIPPSLQRSMHGKYSRADSESN